MKKTKIEKENTFFREATDRLLKAISDSNEGRLTKEELFNYYRSQYNE